MGFLRRLFDRADRPGPRGEGLADRVGPHDPGIFAGLFVAAPEQVEKWDLRGLTPSDWPAVEFKRISTVNLGTLEAILEDRPYEEIDQDRLHNLVRDGGEEGPWISSVREELISALSGLTSERASSTARAWADTDEFKLKPTDVPRDEDVADLTELLIEMVELARRSRQDGKPMYLLMGL